MNNITETEVGEAPQAPIQPPTFDPDEYRHHLAGYELGRAKEDELLSTIWNIIVQFVDIGFGQDPLQTLFGPNWQDKIGTNSDSQQDAETGGAECE